MLDIHTPRGSEDPNMEAFFVPLLYSPWFSYTIMFGYLNPLGHGCGHARKPSLSHAGGERGESEAALKYPKGPKYTALCVQGMEIGKYCIMAW